MPVRDKSVSAMRASRWRQYARQVMSETLPRRLLLIHGPRSSSDVALTFDDGPDPNHTPRLLDVLRALAIPATFFVIGERAERYPDLVRRIIAEGHALGGHSYYHSSPDQTPARQLMAEVARTCDVLDNLSGESTRLFRPPHGRLTVAKVLRLWQRGQSVVLWNVDPKDFACELAREVSSRLATRPLQGGDVVLMHDNVPYASEVIPALADDVFGRGLRFTTVVPWVLGNSLGERSPLGHPEVGPRVSSRLG